LKLLFSWGLRRDPAADVLVLIFHGNFTDGDPGTEPILFGQGTQGFLEGSSATLSPAE
jgi:hypothetical protein